MSKGQDGTRPRGNEPGLVVPQVVQVKEGRNLGGEKGLGIAKESGMMRVQQRDSFGCRIHGDGNKTKKKKKKKKKRIRF